MFSVFKLERLQHKRLKSHSCLRNVISLFHIIEKEQAWRKEKGRPEGFDTLNAFRPIVAVGAEEPLADQLVMADFFRKKRPSTGVFKTYGTKCAPGQMAKTVWAISILR